MKHVYSETVTFPRTRHSCDVCGQCLLKEEKPDICDICERETCQDCCLWFDGSSTWGLTLCLQCSYQGDFLLELNDLLEEFDYRQNMLKARWGRASRWKSSPVLPKKEQDAAHV